MTRVFPACLLLTACLACTSTVSARQQGADAMQASAASRASITVSLDAATLAGLPQESVSASARGQTLNCDGVPLVAVLRASGAMPVDPLRGADLARYVLVTARDGYRAVYSLAELDPSLGSNKVLLVGRCDGKALDDKDGPLRLIAPDESRPARWVRQVESITVVTAP